MAIFPCGSAIQPAVSGEFYDHPINQSLRFNDDDSAYLSWTPASPGNRKTWTWSGWVKRGNIDTSNSVNLFSVEGQTYNNNLRFTGSGSNQYTFHIQFDGGNGGSLLTNALYRDTSAWYHIVVQVDTTQATSTNRVKLYINGEQITSLKTSNYPSQNYDTGFNAAQLHSIGRDELSNNDYLDGYLAEVHFIDGAAYDASYFGETVSGVWKPIEYTGGYGDNGFYLPFNHDYSVEGFSATTYTGNGGNLYVGGVGFQPDLVWTKERGANIGGSNAHYLYDSVRGVGNSLNSEFTYPEGNVPTSLTSFDSDGFSSGSSAALNEAGASYIAWCWDAGSGSPVSNTDGSITSTVKASTTYGFSIVSYTGNGTGGATVGHGLSSAPEMVIVRERGNVNGWYVYHNALGASNCVYLNATNASTSVPIWNSTAPSSSVITYSGGAEVNRSGGTYIAYCFHSVSGYSKIGSYTGTGASGNSVTTGFKPAFVLIKSSTGIENWMIYDSTRDPSADATKYLIPNSSGAEGSLSPSVEFTSTGFTVNYNASPLNTSGGTYIYMAFADKREAAFWLDQSGNNNDFENNNLTESDISLDSPTNNFATLNPLAKYSSNDVLAEGNLYYSNTAGSAAGNVGSTIAMTSGKWYAEALCRTTNLIVGVRRPETYSTMILGDGTYDYGYVNSAYIKHNGSDTSYGATYTTGDVIGIALDLDAGTLTFYKNGVSQGTAATGLSGEYVFCISDNAYATSAYANANFGQDSSFAGNKVAQGNTDDNGYGDFYYAPPTGYLALCTANLEVPDAMNPALDNSPQDYFNTVLYTGNGSTQSITGVGFQPDFTWIKERDSTSGHGLIDSVRGVSNTLFTNATNAEETSSTWVTSFDSDGFSVGTNNGSNESSKTLVSWNWKAGGSSSSNTDGSITSTVSANTDAGFSIVTWTGTDATATVGHGLSQAPEMIIVKDRNAAYNWVVYSESIGNTKYLRLNTTDAAATYNMWNNTSPTSSVFSLSGYDWVNNLNDGMIAYCFHSVEGFSKFGSYTGNGSTDGPFVYTGFRPAFVLTKVTSQSSNWVVHDNKRDIDNTVLQDLYPDLSAVEQNYNSNQHDFLSNGFKLRATGMNASGQTYIYMAFAEMPTKFCASMAR